VIDRNIKGRHHPMPTTDGLDPAHPLPVFLDDQYERQDIGMARDRSVISSRVLKASILIVTAAVLGLAALSGNPLALFAEVTASLADNFGLQPAAPPSTPDVQATADAQVVPPTAQAVPPAAEAVAPAAQDTPARDEIAAAEPAGQDQAEKSEPPPEALFRQFQAWAADKDAEMDVAPARPVQDASPQTTQNAPPQAAENAQAAENPRPSLRIMQESRRVRAVHRARAEMRTETLRKQARRPYYARAPIPPAQVARAQDARAEAARAQEQSMPVAQTPSFLPIFGGRN
jgi:hypothetical protein